MIDKIIEEHISVISTVKASLQSEIAQFAAYCQQALASGNTIFFMGNGGSAADSQHLAAEFVGRFLRERRGLPSVALTTDTSILTAVGNDYGFDYVFARQVEALAQPGDVIVGLSASGNSPNVLRALEAGRALGAVTIGLTGQSGGKMVACCDLCIKAPSEVTARIQEAHGLIGHIVCAIIDEAVNDVSK